MLLTSILLLLSVTPDSPYIAILGTAQDGGLPQIGCHGPQCSKAKADPAMRRLISSLLIVHPETGQRWLIDATPDIREQTVMIENLAGRRESPDGKRPKIVDGVFLTHAHIGHYTGLTFFGREAYSHPGIPVFGTQRMAGYLANNGPWRLLIENGNLKPSVLEPNQPHRLAPGLTITAIPVPHRDEFTDTVGYIVRGPSRAVLFIPDIDKWEKWPVDIAAMIAKVDVALLDGTFFADGEIPGRAMAEIPHPFIVESLARFRDLPKSEREKIAFIHLNHTNPAADSTSDAAARVRNLDMSISADGQIIQLSLE